MSDKNFNELANLLDTVEANIAKYRQDTANQVAGILRPKLERLHELEPAFEGLVFGMGGHGWIGKGMVTLVDDDSPGAERFDVKACDAIGREARFTGVLQNKRARKVAAEIVAMLDKLEHNDSYRIYCMMPDIRLLASA